MLVTIDYGLVVRRAEVARPSSSGGAPASRWSASTPGGPGSCTGSTGAGVDAGDVGAGLLAVALLLEPARAALGLALL